MATDDPHPAQRLIERAADLRRKRAELETEQEKFRSEFTDPKFAPVVEAVVGPAPPRGLARSGTIFDQIWERIDRVLQSGAFYFFAGLAMLLYAFQTSNAQEHPSLTFLIAMLGFAIMLFGTGSQAAGAIATGGARLPRVSEARGTDAPNTGAAPAMGEPGSSANMQAMLKAIAEGNAKPSDAEKAQALAGLEPIAKAAAAELDTAKRAAPATGGDWTPVKANAAIAGGAAVLAAIFGVGVIHYSDKIRDVFNDFERYEIVSLQACSGYVDSPTGALLCDPGQVYLSELKLDNYVVRALNARGVAVPFWQDGKRINILVFRHEMRMGRFIRLTASRLDDPTELSGSVHSKEVDVMIPLDPPPAAAAASAAAAACVPVQAGPTCRLARIDLPADQEGRVKTTYFSLNFAEVAKREDKDASIKIQFQ